MKTSFIYSKLIFLMLALALGGCSKSFFDLENPQSVRLKGTIIDLPSLTTACNGAYIPFKNVNYYNRTFSLVPDLLGDNVFISRSNTGKYLDEDNFAISNVDSYITGAWSAMYQVIVNANLAIAGGELLGNSSPVNQLMGEMYGIRALAYFDLVRFFAQPYNFTADASHLGVPLVLEPKNEIIAPPRATVKEVYTQITEDLKKALTLMTTPQKPGHFVPAAANALLAKAYLYMEDWANAEKYASDAIAGPFNLLTITTYVPSWGSDYSSESLFEIVNLGTDNPGTNSLGYLYQQAGYGEALATQDLYQQYTSTDVRRSLIQVGVRGSENPAYFVKKYPKGTIDYSDHMKVLRLSDAYLIRAEARAELGKTDPSKNTLALSDLNTIVKRADASAANITLTGDALVQRIILERRKEFAFEGNRFFDLTRRKMDVRHIRSDEEITYTYPNDKFVMPIPFAETSVNKNIIQNPGYQQ